LLTARLHNVNPYWGNDMLKVIGIGEFNAGVSLFPMPTPAWVNGTRKIAEAGWRNENHGLLGVDCEAIVTGWETVNRAVPIHELRWVLAHAWGSTEAQWERLKAMGCAINVTGGAGYQGTNTFPFRDLWDSGIKAGFGADGPDVMPLNPWQNISFAVTGHNVRGQATNEGQRLTRQQALRWYTSENGWFTREEDDLGSIEVGKLADLVVLNHDYFSVRDDELDKLASVLTVVGGQIAYDAGVVT
jgi:predicted amidohydrolase YtcJ